MTTLITLVLLVALAAALWRLRQLQRHIQRQRDNTATSAADSLPAAIPQAQAATARHQVHYLQSIVDHMPQGISVFDDQLHLRCWNAVLADVLELPPESLYDGVPFEDLIMYPARRGEYGPGDPKALVAARRDLALKFLPHRFERTRPNGRTHLVEGKPMLLNGEVVGFVTSYTDITDRKHAEEAMQSKNALLQTLVDNMPGGVTVFGPDLRMILYNNEVLRLLDFPAELAGQHPHFSEVIRTNAERGEYGDVDVESKVAEMLHLAQNPKHHRVERIRPDGTAIEIRGAPIPGGGFVTIYSDITERIEKERELTKRNQIFSTLIDNIPGGVTLFDSEFRLVTSNREYRRLLDFPDHLFEDTPTLERFFRFNVERSEYGDCDDREAKVEALMETARQSVPHVFERTRPDGTVLEIRGMPLPDGGFVTIYSDITEHKRAAEAIEKLAHEDALTGLANRYTLEARLDQSLADMQRHHKRLALIFIDMDNFKAINDSLGHAVGDEFLIEIAQRLLQCVRGNDIVGRPGGDEFVIAITDLEESTRAAILASEILQALALPLQLGPHQVVPSASLGISIYPDDGRERVTLMKNADIAMYSAKSAGRNRFRFFDARMTQSAETRLRLEGELRQALERKELVLHYQPQIRASNGRIIGFEALVRWQKADGELVAPMKFIPLAEETGLIVPIGQWVLRTACLTLAAWHKIECMQELSISVNLSARQLIDETFIDQVDDILTQTGIHPHLLELEITESVAMENPVATVETLLELKALGVKLSIDDFGTGYSSLAYLKLLPIDRLKLDRAFVMDIETDPNDAAICTATIGLAHNLGLEVIAEGVESRAQSDYLSALDCDYMQGYYFSPPLTSGDAAAFATTYDGIIRR
ncbi:PAS-domain containing protein [Sedimenticola hydrogenitrophicus]|uniref:PAS-domain containing protein n=1 Tax=Sedimenticola hydrogenitrophicus TaxID=2967975 RepID=UPI0021A8E3B8|nr:PAS-domain containing protein [Sedimenticola hydrogenitrophicus]